MSFDERKNILSIPIPSKKIFMTIVGTFAFSASLFIQNVESNAAAKKISTEVVQVKSNKKVYSSDQAKSIKSSSAKSYFGNKELFTKKEVTVKKQGQLKKFKLIESKDKTKKGWMYSGDIISIHQNNAAPATVKSAPNLDLRIDDDLGETTDNTDGNVNSMTDAQVVSSVRSQFVDFVKSSRAQTKNGTWLRSSGLDKVAQERADYVNPALGYLSHYITANGKRHKQLAAILDGQSMGIVGNQNDIYESNGYANLDNRISNVSKYVSYFKEMITNDGDSDYGHRDQLLGNEADGLRHYGVGIRVIRMNRSVQINIVILSADSKY